MKGLLHIPNLKQRLSAYGELLEASPSLNIASLVLYIQWARFDARLGEILIKYLEQNWSRINPLELNEEILKQAWPAVLGALLGQVEILQALNKMNKEERERFKNWSHLCLYKIREANNEIFFIGQYSIAGKLMQNQVKMAKQVYADWGYLASDILINKFKNTNQTLIDKSTRFHLLEQLRKQETPFTVEDYLRHLDFAVSRRQAQRDIQHFPKLKSIGFTRNKRWVGTDS